MTDLRPLLLTLLLALLAPAAAFAQPTQPCCVDATCLTAEGEAYCLGLVSPFNDPSIAVSGGTEICGADSPTGILCTSFCQNNPFGFCIACTDPNACNYGVSAELADGCDYPELGYDCDGDCLADINSNGICDNFETAGCTDADACNFMADATLDDGSCTYPEFGFNCDGSCSDDDGDGICLLDEIYGCTDSLAVNYYPIFTEDDGGCIYAVDLCDCPADMNGDNFITVADIIVILGLFEYSCE